MSVNYLWATLKQLGWPRSDGPPRDGEQHLLTSLGLAVIDEIHFGSGKVVTDLLGGSGTYCTVGARLFTAGDSSSRLSWLIRAGEDFPLTIETEIRAWGINLCLQKSPDRRSTRGLLVYKDTTFGPKTFKYTTPVNEVLPKHLEEVDLLSSRYFHILCAPDRIKEQAEELLNLRSSQDLERPFIIWEPSPPMCTAENLEECLNSAKYVDVFSPNHLELLSLFGRAEETFSQAYIQELAAAFLATGVGHEKQGVVVVRAGEHGCLVIAADIRAVWLPPFYESNESLETSSSKIVDTTGAGNAFLGGFVVGHSETNDFVRAAQYGSVAASFVLEQVGVPKLDSSPLPLRGETWNGEAPRKRLYAYQKRLRQSLTSSSA